MESQIKKSEEKLGLNKKMPSKPKNGETEL